VGRTFLDVAVNYTNLLLLNLAGSILLAASAKATSWSAENFAGIGKEGGLGDRGSAVKAELSQPFGIVRGPDQCIYFCEMVGNVVRKVDSQGVLTTIAGCGRKGSGGDGGSALQAEFDMPHEIRFDRAGNLYVADMNNHRIRKVVIKTGRIYSVAGTGVKGFSGDGGAAIAAELDQPLGIQFDAGGDLYICDVGNNRVRKVNSKTGVITTVAGNGERGATPDAVDFRTVPLNTPRALDFDREGNMWLATREGNQVFKLQMAKGSIHRIAGTGLAGASGDDGPALAATFRGIKGLAVSRDGRNLFLADSENHCIRSIDVERGTVERVCGTGVPGDGPEGDALQCKLNNPHGIFEENGSLFISNSQAHRIVYLKRRSP
jgi:DNA-binding beta-propeller fold protein YncE